jgi:hypothetical protein
MVEENENHNDVCPKCGAQLGGVVTLKSGRRLRRCSQGMWDQESRTLTGCSYVKWLPIEPETLEERCPKCHAPLLLVTTRFGKKMKKCSTATWDPKTRVAGGCDYIEWLKGTVQELEEKCPKCQANLVLVTTANNKRLKKCSTNRWDAKTRQAVGCDYIEWLK